MDRLKRKGHRSFVTGDKRLKRNWTGSNGKVIEAEFLSYDSDKEIVKIKLKNGKEQNVKIDLFSKADQDFVKNQGKADDNPFGSQEPESLPDGQVIRVSLNVDGFGNGKICVEKTSEAPKDSFEGREIKIGILPKTKIKMNDKGITNLIQDFRDAGSILCCNHTWAGTKIDEEAKMLVLDPSENETGVTLMGFYKERTKLPLGIVCDVAKFNGELFNFEMIFEPPTKEERSIFTCRIVSKSGIFGPYFVQCRWGKFGGKEIFDKTGSIWIFQDMFQENNLTLGKPFEREFRFPIPNAEIANPFRISIGKNLNSSERQPTDLVPIGISRLEFTCPFSPPMGFGLASEGSKVFAKWIRPDGIGAKAGVQEGDIIVSINGIKPKSLQAASEMLAGTSFDERLTIKVERNGKQKEIVIFDKE